MSEVLVEKLSKIYSNSKKCCELIGLDYHFDSGEGIVRKKIGLHFRYFYKDKELDSKKHLEFINDMRIPPAWMDVWIAPKMKYHLQVTGIDSRGRKQYLYNPKWNEFRQLLKFYRLIMIGEALPKIRAKIEKSLNQEGYSKEKVLSAILKIIDKTYIRIGNEQYANENQSYGITTLRKKHIEVSGSTVSLDFIGKSGQEHQIELKDAKIANIIKKLKSLSGYEVFKYENNGESIDIKSKDVNDYIKEISNEKITAKDFRTWGGTKICFTELKTYNEELNKAEIKKALNIVIDQVSSKLGNTKAVCRSHYIYPQLLLSFEDRNLNEIISDTETKIKVRDSKYFEDDEVLLLQFLKQFFNNEIKSLIE